MKALPEPLRLHADWLRRLATNAYSDTAKQFLAIAEILDAAPTQSASLITVEASLRFRLESEQQKSADLLDEVRELKGKLAAQSAQIPAPLTDKQVEKLWQDLNKRRLADAIEAAHGIAAPQPPQDVARDAIANVIEAAEDLMDWQVKNVKVWNNSAYDVLHKRLQEYRAAIAAQGGKL